MPTIDELTIADEPEAWSALGFEVQGDACRLGEVRVHLAGRGAGHGLVSWSLRDLQRGDLDGLVTEQSARPPHPRAAEHPNGAIAIDHIVAVSSDFPRSVSALQQAGLDLRRVREEPTPAGAPRQAFFRLGEVLLELVQEPQEALERRGGPGRPTHFWGLALLVKDIDASVERLAPHAGEARAAVQPGRRIATVKRSAGLSFTLALMSATEQEVPA
jgi:hypothetical protein